MHKFKGFALGGRPYAGVEAGDLHMSDPRFMNSLCFVKVAPRGSDVICVEEDANFARSGKIDYLAGGIDVRKRVSRHRDGGARLGQEETVCQLGEKRRIACKHFHTPRILGSTRHNMAYKSEPLTHSNARFLGSALGLWP